MRLGWSHGDDEIFSTEKMTEWFDLDGIGRSPARFDFDKLENLNAYYIKSSDNAELTRLARALVKELPADQHPPNAEDDKLWEKLKLAMPGLKERAKTLADLLNAARFVFVSRPLDIDEKANGLLDDDAGKVLGALVERFEDLENWNMDEIERTVRDFAENMELKLGKVAQPLRAALTGRTTSPGIFDVLFALGKKESIARIRDQAT